jgi:hypothetical protein
VLRGLTGNVSSGGIYFETDLTGPEANGFREPGPAGRQLLDMELTVPPGDGHFPYEGRVSTVLEVLRRVDLEASPTADRPRRIGLAGRFHQPLKLTF